MGEISQREWEKQGKFRTDVVLIAIFILLFLVGAGLIVRRDIRMNKDRTIRRAEIQYNQRFMEDCYQIEKKNWKQCRDKLLEMKDISNF